MAEARSYAAGLAAEFFASVFLILKGYRILAWRCKTPVGEIDLVARRGGTLVFVEVKTRKTMGGALESVTPRMQGRISRAAQYFIARNPGYADMEMRFDLIAVCPPFFCWHLDNAWRPPA